LTQGADARKFSRINQDSSGKPGMEPTRQQAIDGQPDPITADGRRAFLLRVAELLHRHGTPSHRLERVMTGVSQRLGIEASYLYTPTALLVAFEKPEPQTRLLRVEAGPVDLGKLYEFDEALERLDDGHATLEETRERVEVIAAAGRRYGFFPSLMACCVASAAATVFFHGGWKEVLLAAILGSMVMLLERLVGKLRRTGYMLEALAGFFAASVSLIVAATLIPLDDRLATMGALIILFPGFSFTVAMTELATRHLSSGVARLAGAGVIFLTLAVGVSLAWRLGQDLRPAVPVILPLPFWSEWIALACAPFAFAILLQARRRQWPVICLVAWCGYVVARLGTAWMGVEFGAFSGALVIGALSNLYARLRDHPAMIPQVPAVLTLVPGSIGFRSVTAFIDQNAVAGVEFAFSMSIIAISIVGGLLAANAVVPPRRSL